MNTLWIMVAVAVIVYMVYRMIPAKGVKSIETDELKELLKDKKNSHQFIDVREAAEYRAGHVPGFKNISLSQIHKRMNDITQDKPVVLMCRSGNRSMQAARILKKNGYNDIINVAGGMMRWKGSVER
ncbi:MAG: rhodanese-like domain-containing protein [Alicyclobacillus sp.]|uniref:rhodanese-like domain-containing protein n=1 Tax=Alicyclobacillus suci TaxID=2816080 RepID=UPI001A8EF8AD|nr:rhodanese-like domain-containing protein [Alicyclobacillus suci]MCL6442649.1 rhodanese-like domain-containing protein [Alicyclobacillus sp.]